MRRAPPPPIPLSRGVLVCAALIAAQKVHAQAPPIIEGAASTALPDVAVQATREQTAEPALSPSTTLSGTALRHRAASTLGATLQDQPGVANASFGANVGLPVIRGLSGSRVRTLVGGAGTNDASTISADHAVMAEPLLADSITVWRGPAAIRFGGGAIGGAVEIEDGRIPTTLPRRTRFKGDARGGTDGRSAMAKLDGRLAGQVAWHVDVHGRAQNDTKVPGWAQDEGAIRQQFGLAPTHNSRGHVPNTDARSGGGAIGASWLGEAGWLGLSLSTLSQNYGIPPGGHSHSHSGETSAEPAQEQVRIDARQQRLDLRGEMSLSGKHLKKIKLRAAHTDYTHDELETGRVSTTFVNRVHELNAELEHTLLQPWLPQSEGEATGSIGVQLSSRAFSALGNEAFAPETNARQAALFAVQGWREGAWQLELGGRIEYTAYRPQPYRLARDGEELIKQPPERRLRPGSWSASVRRDIGSGHLTLTRWMVSRAPDLQELYADGPHMATRTYDLGRESMGVETLRGWDLGITQPLGDVTLEANVYRYASSNYIYQRSTGRYYNTDSGGVRFECARLDLCLPVTQYEQAPAQLQGYELELSRPWAWRQAQGPGLRGRIALTSDAVRGRLVNGPDLPRLPPPRIGLRLEVQHASTLAELHALRAMAQQRPGENETDTDGWFQLHGSLRHTIRLSDGQRLSWFVVARNLTNQQVRNSASFLRSYAPEPGRVVQLGMEVSL